jgi:hypothetical protein
VLHAEQLPLFQASPLPRAVVVERVKVKHRNGRVKLGPVSFEVLLVLPGRADALARRLGLSERQVLGALGQLGVRGLAQRLNGRGASGVWRRS